MPWFRMYDSILDDPKVQLLPGEQFKFWVNILALAKRHDGRLPSLRETAFALRMAEGVVSETLQTLVNAGLVDELAEGRHIPHNWHARQFRSDSSAERVRRYRNVTHAVTVTPPESESETEAETEYSESETEAETEYSESETEAETDNTGARAPDADPETGTQDDDAIRAYRRGGGGSTHATGSAIGPAATESDDLDQTLPGIPPTPKNGVAARVQGEIETAWAALVADCGIAPMRDWTPKRRASLRERLTSSFWRDHYAEALGKIRGSPFLRGANDRRWKANIDWFLRPDTVAKIMEGRYERSRSQYAGPDRPFDED